MKTFYEYIICYEGLWLNDKNAVVGLSRTVPPRPRQKADTRPAPQVKPIVVHQEKPKVGTVANPQDIGQLPDSLTLLARLGIDLTEPTDQELGRILARSKKHQGGKV